MKLYAVEHVFFVNLMYFIKFVLDRREEIKDREYAREDASANMLTTASKFYLPRSCH